MGQFKSLLILVVIYLSGLLSGKAYAQVEVSKFSVSPHFGLGLLIPGQQNVIEGNERMLYQWTFFNVGNVSNSQGVQSFSFETTNRFGVDLNYKFAQNFRGTLGAERINTLSIYRPSLVYTRGGATVGGIVDEQHFYNFNVGLRYDGPSIFYVLKGLWMPNINAVVNKRANEAGNPVGPVNFFNQDNTGLSFSGLSSNDIKGSIYVGIGQDIVIGVSDLELEIGLNLAAVPLRSSEVAFVQNGGTIGRSQINRLVNTVFVSLNQELNFKKRIRKPKVRKPKAEKLKEKVEVGNETLEIGEDLILEGLIFDQSSSELSSENERVLSGVLAFMRRYPKARIQISGHTSDEGDRRANIKLSEERAEACKKYLIKQGVSGRRIITVGRGPDSPISDAEQELNRRVEMKILSLE